jgi:hypothetical protein
MTTINNQLATGASKIGGGWQESINNHTTTVAGDDKQQERAAVDDEVRDKEARATRVMVMVMRVAGDKEGKGGKGHGISNMGGLQQRG